MLIMILLASLKKRDKDSVSIFASLLENNNLIFWMTFFYIVCMYVGQGLNRLQV